jgi:hypothetical protein
VNYAETVLPIRDGLPKLRDFPSESADQERWSRSNAAPGAGDPAPPPLALFKPDNRLSNRTARQSGELANAKPALPARFFIFWLVFRVLPNRSKWAKADGARLQRAEQRRTKRLCCKRSATESANSPHPLWLSKP